MKLPTDNRRSKVVAAITLALMLLPTIAHAQVASSNPLEYVALAEGKRTYQWSDQEPDRRPAEDCIPAEHHRSRVLADSQIGKEVQQLSENGIGLCFHVESLHLAL